MSQLNEKQEKLKAAVQAFESGERTPDDYLSLIVVATTVLRPDSGLVWEQVKEAVASALTPEIQ